MTRQMAVALVVAFVLSAPAVAATKAPSTPVPKWCRARQRRPPQAMRSFHRLAPRRYLVDAEQSEGRTSPYCDVALQCRIVPAFKNGKAIGFKVFSIRPGSLYEAAGLVDGDIVRSINGLAMTSPDSALDIYQRLKDATYLEVALERRGASILLAYCIVRSSAGTGGASP